MEPLAASPKNDVIVAWPAALLPLLPAAFRPADGPEPAAAGAGPAGAGAARADAAGESRMQGAAAAGEEGEEGGEEEGSGWDVALGDGAAAVPRARVQELTARLTGLAAGGGGGRARLALDDFCGARERKLAHALAERLGLRHWSEGRGAARRVVVGNYEGAAAGRANGRGGRGRAGPASDGPIRPAEAARGEEGA
jgi:hypothetical protein